MYLPVVSRAAPAASLHDVVKRLFDGSTEQAVAACSILRTRLDDADSSVSSA